MNEFSFTFKKPTPNAIGKATDEGEWTALQRTAHTLKGSSSTLGLRQLAKTCQDFEAAASNHAADMHTLIGSFEPQFLEMKPVLIAERDRREVSG